ncbi:helix-turn-helix transcriptional regulator [Pedobacter nyackensis]|uniref:helix-turn-helix domain-containing protein n=1 Tax=Pedobacter nyackensis TaxID=475255 RepID=UPI00292EE176|nr:helix-turn-helix transcriptional regulator [Pedobacter nyackensis]
MNEKKKNPEKNEKLIQVFGENVRKFRKERNLSQKELAELCDVDTITVSRIERNISNTTISTIAIIAEALRIPPSKLLED